MNVPFLDLKAQYIQIKSEIIEELKDVCENTSFILGPWVKRFEEAFSRRLNVKYCLGINSGTMALVLALKAAGIKPGDEVITTPNTFIATTEAISLTGASVCFVDIEEDSYNMNPDLIEQAITEKTRCIIPVHLYGQPANMRRIIEIAHKYKLMVIEDACQAHLAKVKMDGNDSFTYAGTIGDAGAFSFYPGKNLGAYGEGGAVVTNSEIISEKVAILRDHGSKEKYIHLEEGYNARLEGFQGAVLGVKMKYIEKWTDLRRAHARYYNELLKNIDEVITPVELPFAYHVYHLYVIRVKNREELKNSLAGKGVGTGYHYKYPLHLQKAYENLGYEKDDFPVTEKVMKEIISLPMYPELTNEQIDYVVNGIKDFFPVRLRVKGL